MGKTRKTFKMKDLVTVRTLTQEEFVAKIKEVELYFILYKQAALQEYKQSGEIELFMYHFGRHFLGSVLYGSVEEFAKGERPVPVGLNQLARTVSQIILCEDWVTESEFPWTREEIEDYCCGKAMEKYGL